MDCAFRGSYLGLEKREATNGKSYYSINILNGFEVTKVNVKEDLVAKYDFENGEKYKAGDQLLLVARPFAIAHSASAFISWNLVSVEKA